jgi:hypothetical protein
LLHHPLLFGETTNTSKVFLGAIIDASNVETSDNFVTEPRRSGRTIVPPEWFHNKILILEDDEPVHYKEVMAGPSSREWHKAKKSEMESITKTKFGTW